MRLGQTESSHPPSSFLCRARQNTGALSLCSMLKNNARRFGDLIGGRAPPSGSRRQGDNTVWSFRHTFCRNWSLQPPRTDIYCSLTCLCFIQIKDSLVWWRDISTYLIQLWRVQLLREVLENGGRMSKGSRYMNWADKWTKVDEKQLWGEKTEVVTHRMP